MSEIWKDIPDYDGYYQASNLGRIRSLDRMVTRVRNGVEHSYFKPGRILLPHIEGSGYWQVLICIHGVIKKHKKVHRLVAQAFIPNPENKRCINHKDGNKGNNAVSNIEWNTHSENLKHAHKTGLKRVPQLGKSGHLHHLSKAVLSINDTAIVEHGSIRECARYLRCDTTNVATAVRKGYNCVGHRIYFV